MNLDGTEESTGAFLERLADEFAAGGDTLQPEISGAISLLEPAFDQLPEIRRVGRHEADLRLLPRDALLFG